MSEAEKVALFDLDGSLADYDGAMKAELAKIACPMEGVPADLRSDEVKQNAWFKARVSLIKNQPGFWVGLEPIELGMELYSLLGEMGFKRMVLTKGPKKHDQAWTEKVQWCNEHVPDAEVTITHDKGLVYGKILYDDYPPYARRWLEWRPRGLVIMRETEYNADFAHPSVEKIRDISDLEDLKPRIEKRFS